MMHRRTLLKSAAIGAVLGGLRSTIAQTEKAPLFKISIAEWSLHKTLFAKKITNLDFPAISKKEFGIEAVEYVNQFFKDIPR